MGVSCSRFGLYRYKQRRNKAEMVSDPANGYVALTAGETAPKSPAMG